MPQKTPITKHTLFLRAGDFDRLREVYPTFGAGPIVRRLVARFVDNISETQLSPEDIRAIQEEKE